MENNGLQENNNQKDGNMQIPKALFAIIIVVLCGTLCYASYITGFMKGKETSAAIAPAPSAQNAPAAQAPAADNGNTDNGGTDNSSANNGMLPADDFFRGLLPFDNGRPGGNQAPGGQQPPAEGNDPAGNPAPDGNPAPGGSQAPAEASEQKAFLNIKGQTVSPELQESFNVPSGVLVREVESGSAAEKAGIPVNSIIKSCDGQTVTTIEELKSVLSGKNPGDTVEIVYYDPVDKGNFIEKTVSVVLDGE